MPIELIEIEIATDGRCAVMKNHTYVGHDFPELQDALEYVRKKYEAVESVMVIEADGYRHKQKVKARGRS